MGRRHGVFDADDNLSDPLQSLINRVRGPDGRPMPRIPIEFSAAAFRYGHSQIRPSYRLNFGATGGAPFFVFTLDDAQDPDSPDPADLRGGKRAPRRFVDWQTFFDFGDGNARPDKRIDSKLSSMLLALPGPRAPVPGLWGRRWRAKCGCQCWRLAFCAASRRMRSTAAPRWIRPRHCLPTY